MVFFTLVIWEIETQSQKSMEPRLGMSALGNPRKGTKTARELGNRQRAANSASETGETGRQIHSRWIALFWPFLSFGRDGYGYGGMHQDESRTARSGPVATPPAFP